MRVKINPDKDFVREVKKKLKDNNNYCPCKLEKNKDTRCMCKEFLESPAGTFCDCGLYIKVED